MAYMEYKVVVHENNIVEWSRRDGNSLASMAGMDEFIKFIRKPLPLKEKQYGVLAEAKRNGLAPQWVPSKEPPYSYAMSYEKAVEMAALYGANSCWNYVVKEKDGL